MLVTGWKKALTDSGRSQRSLAQALNVNFVEVNMVVQGRAWLSPQKFEQACALLDVRPSALYQADVLALLYGIGDGAPKKPEKPKAVQVRLDPDVRDRVDLVAEDEHMTRAQAANAIIRRAFETRRIEE